jgi:hypothetical protein
VHKKTTHQERRVQAWVNAARVVETPQGSEAASDRLHIVKHNSDRIPLAVKGWVDSGRSIADGVVFVVDLDDPEGERFAAAVDPNYKDTIPKDIEGVPTFCVAVSRSFAAKGFETVAPEIGKQLESPPEDGWFYLVCIASGGTTLIEREI